MQSRDNYDTTTTTEYVMDNGEIRHIWNIRSSSDTAIASASAAITEYYEREEMSSRGFDKEPRAVITKAFPRHHALVSRALASASRLTARDFPKYYPSSQCIAASSQIAALSSNLTSVYQKHHLVALSAMSGLLAARLFLTGHSFGRRGHDHHDDHHHDRDDWFAPNHLMRSLRHNAQFTTTYVHSALASDILIGYRYYRHLVRDSELRQPIGNTGIHYKNEDLGSENIIPELKCELSTLYASEIDRLNDAVYQFKRGYINVREIQNDPEFQKLMNAFWSISNKVMKQLNEHKKPPAPIPADRHYFEELEKERKERFVTQLSDFSDISEVLVRVPRLYDYDIVHLFDNEKQSYAKYVRTVKNTSIRLANDGITTSFLGFAAIEPEMVCELFAPKLNGKYLTIAPENYANHKPSRDPIYGPLRIKHLAHITRTAVATQYVEREEPTLQRRRWSKQRKQSKQSKQSKH